MKKCFKIVAAVATVLIAATSAITFEACSKKNEAAKNLTELTTNHGIVYQKNAQDRSAYIAEFEQKLKSTEKSDEFLTLDNANSFLFDILNYDFGDIQKNKLAMSYETTTYTVNVSNGVINLADFANLYEEISSYVSKYYHNLDLVNPHYYYIFPQIEEFDPNATTATVTVETAVSSGGLGRVTTFNNDWCDYFTYEPYNWEDAADTLEYYLNLQFQHELGSGRYFFTNPTPVIFTHQNYSQLFFCGNCANVSFTDAEMCQFMNDYFDILVAYAMAHEGLVVMSCEVIPQYGNPPYPDAPIPMSHDLIGYFSSICSGPVNPGQ